MVGLFRTTTLLTAGRRRDRGAIRASSRSRLDRGGGMIRWWSAVEPGWLGSRRLCDRRRGESWWPRTSTTIFMSRSMPGTMMATKSWRSTRQEHKRPARSTSRFPARTSVGSSSGCRVALPDGRHRRHGTSATSSRRCAMPRCLAVRSPTLCSRVRWVSATNRIVCVRSVPVAGCGSHCRWLTRRRC